MKSIIQNEQICFYCGTTRMLEEHHIFGGANRKWSEKFGLKVFLCNRDHKEAHRDKAIRRNLQVRGQTEWEKHYGSTSDFMAVFGRNYLLEGNDTTEAEKREIDPIERRTEASEDNV